MKKVVVTGMGILSAIGNGIDKVKDSLLNGVSGSLSQSCFNAAMEIKGVSNMSKV